MRRFRPPDAKVNDFFFCRQTTEASCWGCDALSDAIVREFRNNDIDSLRQLVTEVFHETRPKEYWAWMFIDNPAGQGISMVAELSGQIVGSCALVPTKLRIGNETVLGALGTDALTHPEHQGLFAALCKACMDAAASKGVEVAYGTPYRKSPLYPWLVNVLNWDHTGDIPQWLRVLKPTSRDWELPHAKRLVAFAMHLMPIGDGTPPGIDVRVERPTDDELASLADTVASKLPARTCSVERSKEWFRWRFDPASQRQYYWFSAYRGHDLKAWAVFRPKNRQLKGQIDMAGSDPKALEAAVSAATRRAKELGLTKLVSITNDVDAIRALKACGYFRFESDSLCVKSFTNRILNANIHLHSSWRVSSQDKDAF